MRVDYPCPEVFDIFFRNLLTMWNLSRIEQYWMYYNNYTRY